MNLNDLLKGYDFKLINGDKNTRVSDITYSSKEVKKNSLFVAIKGEKSDGYKFGFFLFLKIEISNVIKVFHWLNFPGKPKNILFTRSLNS